MEYVFYFLIAGILLVAELGYFRLAARYGIIDRPNDRSSHIHPTIRGGGVIFIVAALLFSLLNSGAYPFLMAGLLFSGLVSFIDDMRTLPSWLRFLAHLSSALLILCEAGLFTLPLLHLLFVVVLIIGVINAYNFMDGINGITGFYSLAVLLPLFFSEQDLQLQELQLFSILGILVFLYFNARKKARCFAGDVGSVGMAILIIFFLVTRVYKEQNLNYLGFLLLYGTDTVLTIVQRLCKRENIFRAHRKHLFQIGCNEFGISHLAMSALYGGLQLGINILIIFLGNDARVLPALILSAGISYLFIKLRLWRTIDKKQQ